MLALLDMGAASSSFSQNAPLHYQILPTQTQDSWKGDVLDAMERLLWHLPL